ncbi:MAG: Hint domain-containing protein [Roseovarius confluentis]
MGEDHDYNELNGALETQAVTECFLTGTRIATPEGETAVENLAIGDIVLTAEGKTVPVRWIGWQKVVCVFQPPERLMPVRVSAGALGNGLPHRDLTLTTDHALFIDGMLVNAGTLVNGSTITLVPLSEFDGSYTVYHVETENHDLILAEGTAAETYIDYLGRSNFHNYPEYLELYGEEVTISEMTLPRVSASRLVPDALRRKLSANNAAKEQPARPRQLYGRTRAIGRAGHQRQRVMAIPMSVQIPARGRQSRSSCANETTGLMALRKHICVWERKCLSTRLNRYR